MRILTCFLLLAAATPVLAQQQVPDSTRTPVPAPVAKPDSAKSDPAAYLRRPQLQAPSDLAQPAPTGAVQIKAAPTNERVLTPTGYQNSQGVGSTVEFKGKAKKKRKPQ